MIMLPRRRKVADAGAGNCCADPQPLLFVAAKDIQFGDTLDIHHQGGALAVLLHLRDEIRSTGEQSAFAVCSGQKVYGFLQTRRCSVFKLAHTIILHFIV